MATLRKKVQVTAEAIDRLLRAGRSPEAVAEKLGVHVEFARTRERALRPRLLKTPGR